MTKHLLALSCVIICLSWFACRGGGGGDGGTGTSSATATSTGSDPDAETATDTEATPEVKTATVGAGEVALALEGGALAGSNVAFPAGALPEGATVTLQGVEPPEKFAALAAANPPASAALSVTAVDTDGKSIETATTPFTVAIALDAAAGSSLADDALCVLHAAVAEDVYVAFRGTTLDLGDAQLAKVQGSTFGSFQAVHCGDRSLAGFDTAVEPEPALDGAAGEAFAALAGSYDFIASITQGDDQSTWKHGETYKVVITAGGSVRIATADGDDEVFHYGDAEDGDATDDVIEDVEHELNVILHAADDVSLILQRVKTGDDAGKIFVSWHKGEYPLAVYWRFDHDGPRDGEGPGPVNAEIRTAYGTWTHHITYVTGGDDPAYQVNDAVSVTVDTYGNATGTFGDFPFQSGDTSINEYSSTKDGVTTEHYSITWYSKTDHTSYPLDVLTLEFTDGAFIGGNLKRQSAASSYALHYFMVAN